MTYLEKFRIEYPSYKECSDEDIIKKCCPDEMMVLDWDYDCDGFDNDHLYECVICWNREIPGTEPTNNEIKKETKKMTTRKTKTELLEELEQKKEEIAELRKQVEKAERYKAYDDMAAEMKAMQDSFINAGFSEKQAYTMLMTLIGQASEFAKIAKR